MDFPEYPAVFSIWGINEADEAKRFASMVKFLKERKIIEDYNQVALLLKRVIDTEVDVSVEKDNYILTGKIDLFTGKDGKLEVLDFKTQVKPEKGFCGKNSAGYYKSVQGMRFPHFLRKGRDDHFQIKGTGY